MVDGIQRPQSRNITWSEASLSRHQRETLLGQRGCVCWFTGLSGSGKSTIARACEERLVRAGRLAYVLDGDNVRYGLNGDLGFDAADRRENIRRIGEVANLFCDAGVVVLAAFISPYRADRERARSILAPGRFIEIHVATDLALCEERDVKGLYARARAGEITDFTGVSAPYEVPEAPELVLDTATRSVDDSVQGVLGYLRGHGLIHFSDEDAGGGI